MKPEFKEFETKCWVLMLTAIKGLLTFAFATLHLIFFILCTVLCLAGKYINQIFESVMKWQPSQPRVFGGQE